MPSPFRLVAVLAVGVVGLLSATAVTFVVSSGPTTHVEDAAWQDTGRGRPYRYGGPPVVAPDGRTITIHYTGGSCDTGVATDVVETDTIVQVTIERTSRGRSCDAVGHPRTTTARLAAPLGDRALVDGARPDPDPQPPLFVNHLLSTEDPASTRTRIELSGVLSEHDGCLWIGAWPAIWPPATRWDDGVLTLPTGRRVVPGDRVTGAGTYLGVDETAVAFDLETRAALHRCGAVSVAVFNAGARVSGVG